LLFHESGDNGKQTSTLHDALPIWRGGGSTGSPRRSAATPFEKGGGKKESGAPVEQGRERIERSARRLTSHLLRSVSRKKKPRIRGAFFRSVTPQAVAAAFGSAAAFGPWSSASRVASMIRSTSSEVMLKCGV